VILRLNALSVEART